MLGETILSLLDAGFGRSAGLALVSVAAAAATVGLVGPERTVNYLGRLAALLVFRLRPSAFHVPRLHRPRLRLAAAAPAANEPVILGRRQARPRRHSSVHLARPVRFRSRSPRPGVSNARRPPGIVPRRRFSGGPPMVGRSRPPS